MSKIFDDCASREDKLRSPTLERTTSFSLHRSINVTPAHRLAAAGKKGGGISGDASAASTGSESGNSEDVNKILTPDPQELAISNNSMFCSLVDCFFLLGPSARSIHDQIELRRDERQQQQDTATTTDASAALSTGAASESSATQRSVPDFNAVVPPTVIFCTENNYPGEMFSLLPCYCFPR